MNSSYDKTYKSSLIQCAAVKTCLVVIKDPPMNFNTMLFSVKCT